MAHLVAWRAAFKMEMKGSVVQAGQGFACVPEFGVAGGGYAAPKTTPNGQLRK